MYPVRVLLVRGMTPWTNFGEFATKCLTDLKLSDGRSIICRICPSFSLYQIERVFDEFDPTVVIWCRIPVAFVPYLKKYHIGKTFILYNWDSPSIFWSRTHMNDVVCEMDHVFTSDTVLTESSTFLLPPPECAGDDSMKNTVTVSAVETDETNHPRVLHVFCNNMATDTNTYTVPNEAKDIVINKHVFCDKECAQTLFTEMFDVSICVTTLYKQTDNLCDIMSRTQLFKALEDSNLSFGLFGPDTELSMFTKSYRGYVSPAMFPLVVKSSRLCLNLHQHDDAGYINQRTVNITASGGAMIVEGSSGVLDHFTHEKNAIIVPKGTPVEDWVRIIETYIDQDKRGSDILDTVRKNAKTWQETHATWHIWSSAIVSCIQTHVNTMCENVLYVKPFCGLCNQLTVVCHAISIAKQTNRRVWVDGFQPSYETYSNKQRLRFDDMFDLLELSSVFGLPIREVPEWFRKDELYASWGPLERPSQSKKFKNAKQVYRVCLDKGLCVVNGGFLFINGYIDEQIKMFVRSMRDICKPCLSEAARHISQELGLVDKKYNAIHIRLETDMVNHLSRRRGKTQSDIKNILFEKTNDMIQFLVPHSNIVSVAEEHMSGDNSPIPTFMAYGQNMDNNANMFVKNMREKIRGVDSCGYTDYIREKCGRGREIAAIVDFLICINGSMFAGSNISTFSIFISKAYEASNTKIIDI